MQEILENCERLITDNGYMFAPQKCDIVTPRDYVEKEFVLWDTITREVEFFKYLGILMTDKGVYLV